MFLQSDYLRVPTDKMPLPRDDSDHEVARAFRSFINDPAFPCVGAKAAVAKGDLKIIVADDIAADRDDNRIFTALLGFIARYRSRPDLFQSFAVVFEHGQQMGEDAFETHLWQRIQAVADRDDAVGHQWDARVARDPANPHFSLSFAGEAFFVVGLHPGASRPARCFRFPTLVFNLHDQFERLRADGRYEKLRRTILQRDEALAGSANPMLARHGESSEARQYSGRAVEETWRCPFQPPGQDKNRQH